MTLTHLQSSLWKPRNDRIPFNAAYLIAATYASIGFAIPIKHWQSTSELTLINTNDPRSMKLRPTGAP